MFAFFLIYVNSKYYTIHDIYFQLSSHIFIFLIYISFTYLCQIAQVRWKNFYTFTLINASDVPCSSCCLDATVKMKPLVIFNASDCAALRANSVLMFDTHISLIRTILCFSTCCHFLRVSFKAHIPLLMLLTKD